MTIINTNYSTIEEAWGVDRIDRKNPMKKPVCNLYENRNKPISKPHRNNTSHDMNYKQDKMFDHNEDYDKYYGYTDVRSHSRTRKPLKNHKMYYKNKGRKHISINPKTNKYIHTDNENVYQEDNIYEEDDVIEENLDEEDVYEEDNIYEQNGMENITTPYEEVYDEHDDNYLTNINKTNQHLDKYIKEEIEEEDMYPSKKRYYNNRRKNNNTNDAKKQMLDISIYTISGVLVIFMMEQFVQMGIKIKTYN